MCALFVYLSNVLIGQRLLFLYRVILGQRAVLLGQGRFASSVLKPSVLSYQRRVKRAI
jgi:hypothetical protein